MKSNTDLSVQLTDQPVPPSDQSIVELAQATDRATWRRPTLTRIDIKRTLFTSGSPNDNLQIGSTPG